MARLHKGEAVLTAEENNGRQKGGNTINFSVNISGGGNAKEITEALKKEIRFGTLGMVIEERIQKAG